MCPSRSLLSRLDLSYKSSPCSDTPLSPVGDRGVLQIAIVCDWIGYQFTVERNILQDLFPLPFQF